MAFSSASRLSSSAPHHRTRRPFWRGCWPPAYDIFLTYGMCWLHTPGTVPTQCITVGLAQTQHQSSQQRPYSGSGGLHVAPWTQVPQFPIHLPVVFKKQHLGVAEQNGPLEFPSMKTQPTVLHLLLLGFPALSMYQVRVSDSNCSMSHFVQLVCSVKKRKKERQATKVCEQAMSCMWSSEEGFESSFLLYSHCGS